jgi:hypothetical protein
MTWRDRAACAGSTVDFITPTVRQLPDAIAICQTCPVMDDCRRWAHDSRIEYGVFGGVLFHQGLVTDQHPNARPNAGRKGSPIVHGTNSGYKKELRRGIPPCRPCQKANQAVMRDLSAKRRRAA